MIQEALEVCSVIFFVWVGWWFILSCVAWLLFSEIPEIMRFMPFATRAVGLVAAIVTYVRW